MKKILFGTGTISKELSLYIGIENIGYYVDNNPHKVGTYFNSKKVLSVKHLNADQEKFEIIIAASDEYEYQIAKQLDNMQINYSSFSDFPNYIVNKTRKIIPLVDIIKNNCLLEANYIVIWGNSLYARELAHMLSDRGIKIRIVDCKKIEYKEIHELILDKQIDFHVICFSNVNMHIERKRSEKIRDLIFFKNIRNVVDCFDQDMFEENFNNIHVKKYKNSYNGRCFIIGNGPSLKAADLERLYEKNEITFACNQIYKIFDQVKWRPDFYCCVDDLVIRQHIDSIINIDCKDKFLFDYFHYYNIEKKKDISYIHVKCMEYEETKPKFSNDISKEVYMGYTVTYTMFQIACYMGFKEIYLIGVDHSDLNKHFIDDYYDENDKCYPFSLGDKALLAYKSAKEYCENNNIKVYNATRGGKLNIFDRINFDRLFEK